MRIIILLTLLILSFSSFAQNDNQIIFQYSSQSIIIRKSGENNPVYYSTKNDKLITFKEELSAYPDSTYFLVKPTLVIFEAKNFESDLKPQINIRVDFYYKNSLGNKVKIDSWEKSYYPTIKKITTMQDTRDTDGRVSFTMDDKSEWIVEIDGNGNISIYYLNHNKLSYLDFALMIPNCKKEIENGIRF